MSHLPSLYKIQESHLIIAATSDDSHYFFIFYRMLTVTEQNMYFDYATCSFAPKVTVIVSN